MSQNFMGKKYILKNSENFDTYMKALGVGLTLRKMGNTVKPECILMRADADNYAFVLENPYRCSRITFSLDKEFAELTLDNRRVNTVCHLNGNVFEQYQSADGLKPTKIVREYKDDELVTTLTVGDVKAVRVYVISEQSDREHVTEVPK